MSIVVRDSKGKSLLSFPSDYVVIDIETTGLDPSYDEIIELCAVRYTNDKEMDSFTSFVKPENPISDFITQLTGITNEMVSNADSIDAVLPQFLAFVADSPLVGHNVHFDINFIYDRSLSILGKPFSNDFADTLRLSRRLFPSLKKHKLSSLTEYFGIDSSSMHRAAVDCAITNYAYQRCKSKAVEDFGSIAAFEATVQKSQSHAGADARTITTGNTDFDTTHPLYGKVCVFTGTLERFARKDAMQAVVDLGGACGNTVTKSTNYLILGNLDYAKSIKDGKSSKQKTAERYKLEGLDIEIISENVFYELLGDSVVQAPAQASPEEQLSPFEVECLHIISSILADNNVSSPLIRWEKNKLFQIDAFYPVLRIGIVRKRFYLQIPERYISLVSEEYEHDITSGSIYRFYLNAPSDLLNFTNYIATSFLNSLSSFDAYQNSVSQKTVTHHMNEYISSTFEL